MIKRSSSPHLSYLIWFTPRTGSTALCETISSLRRAGTPGEHLLLFEGQRIRDVWGVDSYADLQQQIWKKGSTDNGVFGVKYAMHGDMHRMLLEQLAGLPDAAGRTGKALFDGLFPHCRHFFLSRIDKVSQVVSWWKAIQTQQWHIRKGESSSLMEDTAKRSYDLAAFQHLLKEISLRETAIARELATRDVAPRPILYEHFVHHPDDSLRAFFEDLGLPPPTGKVDIPLKKTSDQLNQQWEHRLRSDLQEGWNNKAW